MPSQWYAKTLATPAVENESSWCQYDDRFEHFVKTSWGFPVLTFLSSNSQALLSQCSTVIIYDFRIKHFKCTNKCQSVFVKMWKSDYLHMFYAGEGWERRTTHTHIINSAKQIGLLFHSGHLNKCNFQSVLQPLCSTDQRRCAPHRQALGVTQAEVPTVFRARQTVGALWKLSDKSQQRKKLFPHIYLEKDFNKCISLE